MNHFKVSIGYSKSKPIIIVYYNQMRHRYWNGKAIDVNLKSVENATLLKAAIKINITLSHNGYKRQLGIDYNQLVKLRLANGMFYSLSL